MHKTNVPVRLKQPLRSQRHGAKDNLKQIAYIHNNSARRGLCARPEDWLWTGAADYAGVRIGPLRLDRESLLVILGSEEVLALHMPTQSRNAVGMAPGAVT